jgi:hypothetical protein
LITFSNLRADAEAAFTVSEARACALLDALIDGARELARDRWQRELIAWLAERSRAIAIGMRAGLDLGDVAWTPIHFAGQRDFVIDACARAAARATDTALAGDLTAFADLAARHLREHVVVGRRWHWLDRNSFR